MAISLVGLLFFPAMLTATGGTGTRKIGQTHWFQAKEALLSLPCGPTRCIWSKGRGLMGIYYNTGRHRQQPQLAQLLGQRLLGEAQKVKPEPLSLRHSSSSAHV